MRIELKENAVMKVRFTNTSWLQAARYAFDLNINKSETTVAKVIQDGDKLVILK